MAGEASSPTAIRKKPSRAKTAMALPAAIRTSSVRPADQNVDDLGRAAADGGQRHRPDKTADNEPVHRVVKLLDAGAGRNGEKEHQQALPDRSGGEIFVCKLCFHSSSAAASCSSNQRSANSAMTGAKCLMLQ